MGVARPLQKLKTETDRADGPISLDRNLVRYREEMKEPLKNAKEILINEKLGKRNENKVPMFEQQDINRITQRENNDEGR